MRRAAAAKLLIFGNDHPHIVVPVLSSEDIAAPVVSMYTYMGSFAMRGGDAC